MTRFDIVGGPNNMKLMAAVHIPNDDGSDKTVILTLNDPDEAYPSPHDHVAIIEGATRRDDTHEVWTITGRILVEFEDCQSFDYFEARFSTKTRQGWIEIDDSSAIDDPANDPMRQVPDRLMHF